KVLMGWSMHSLPLPPRNGQSAKTHRLCNPRKAGRDEGERGAQQHVSAPERDHRTPSRAPIRLATWSLTRVRAAPCAQVGGSSIGILVFPLAGHWPESAGKVLHSR